MRYTPLTQPAKEISKTAYKTDEIKYYGNSIESYSVSTTYQNYYWTYGTSYTIDKDTGNKVPKPIIIGIIAVLVCIVIYSIVLFIDHNNNDDKNKNEIHNKDEVAYNLEV